MKNKFALMACAALVAFAFSAKANASLVLVMFGSSTTEVIIDGAGSGVLSSGGSWTSTVADGNGVAGVVSFSGVVDGFTVNVTTGLSQPAIGPRTIDLNSVNVSGGAGTLTMGLVDTDFIVPAAGTYGIRSSIGGTTQGTVNFVYGGALDSNAEVGFPILTSMGPFGPGAFSGTDNGSVFLSGLFSMALQVTITHTSAGQVTSFDNMLQIVPEPGTLAIWSMLGVAGLVIGRRRKLA